MLVVVMVILVVVGEEYLLMFSVGMMTPKYMFTVRLLFASTQSLENILSQSFITFINARYILFSGGFCFHDIYQIWKSCTMVKMKRMFRCLSLVILFWVWEIFVKWVIFISFHVSFSL